MNAVAQVAALIGALIYLAVGPMECFLIGRPAVQRFLRVKPNNISDIRLWAFSVGWCNILVGLGTILGLIILHTGNPVVGETIVITVCTFMVVAAINMWVADMMGFWPRRGDSIPGTLGASLPALIAILATALL